jgi:GAF domain-containing protein
LSSTIEVPLGRGADAVPRARRLIRDLLDGVPGEWVGDAALVTTELVTNAVLHGEPPITLSVTRLDPGVRVGVRDTGRSLPMEVASTPQAMTGRGLSVVSAIASTWGVTPAGGGGKVVWAEVGGPSATEEAEGAGTPAVPAPPPSPGRDAPPRHTVRLGAVPTSLLVEAKAQMDNVVRELTLMREGQRSDGGELSPEMDELIETVTVDFADIRTEMKRQASAAERSGNPVTYLQLDLPPDAAVAAQRYLGALDAADRYARRARLLTLASPPSHRAFRRWYIDAIISQMQAIARGEEPPPARPFALALTDEVDRLSRLRDVSERLELLERVNAELTRVHTPEDMATVMVANAARFFGIESARVFLLTGAGTLRSVAWHAKNEPDPDPFVEFPLDADLPGAVAVRTREPMFVPSVSELFDRFPDVARYYHDERSLHLVPLVVGEQALGLLVLTFLGGAVRDQDQLALAQSLADALAQGLERAHLAASDREANETMSLLSDAIHIMVSTRDPSEVLDRLVHLAVPRLGDWCTVYLAEGGVLRRVAMAIDGYPELAGRLVSEPLRLDVDNANTRAFRTGRPQPVVSHVGRLLTELYPDIDFPAMGGDDASSGLVVPIHLRGETIGIIGLAFLGSGRRFTPRVEEALSGLASRAAIAFDNARHWVAQQQLVQSLVGALLPPMPPVVEGVSSTARYLPAGADVAGDWWEADPMPDGSLLVGLGDAAGHGLDAVSLMLELRHGARALAAVEASPAALLSDLNRR